MLRLRNPQVEDCSELHLRSQRVLAVLCFALDFAEIDRGIF